MDYDENYMLNHDIDCFCNVNGVYIHLASAGGILPKGFRNREFLRNLQHRVANAPFIYREDDVIYNEEFLNLRFANNPKGRVSYLVTFKEMAMKGFVSMDRTDLVNPLDNHYHIVCYPKKLDHHELMEMRIPILNDKERLWLDMRPLQIEK